MAEIVRIADGTRILKQVAKPTHFTRRQIAATVRKVKHERLRQRI